MMVREFIYNSTRVARFDLDPGSFSFVAGNLIKTGDLKINVPTASLAIHGVAVPAEVTANSSFAKFSLLGQPVDETTGSGSSDAPNIVYFLYDHFTGGAIGSIDRGSSSVIFVAFPRHQLF